MNRTLARFFVLGAAAAGVTALPGCSQEQHHDYDAQAQPAGYHYESDYRGPYPYYGPEYYRQGESPEPEHQEQQDGHGQPQDVD